MIEQHLFNNRYRLDGKLGEGGMATVYCGTDTLLRRRVAIKVLREQYASDEEFVRRFYAEAEAAAKLSHPNIVNTYDVGREGDTYYIIMELVDGPSLAEVISADGRLPEPVAIDYAAQICSGLAYAHRAGLLHRDIKPANILITKDDVVKISDFGIARAVSAQTMAMTKPGLVMGSVFYLSPEQAQGLELHESSDLYSVGIVLYQMLTGKVPYGGESPVTVALKHIGDPVPDLQSCDADVSPALGAIVNRLLQKRPENRFASASEVATALRAARERPAHAAYRTMNDAPTQLLRSIAPPPRPSPYPDRRAVEVRRRSPVAAVAALVVALALAVAVGYAIFGRPLPRVFQRGIAVGDYRGMSDRQAQQAIVNAGFNYTFVYRPSETVLANHVISQDPAPDTHVSRNSKIKLFISNGLPPIGLSDFRNYTLNDAQRDLQREKFVTRVKRVFSDAAKGTVIDQHPAANTKLRPGSTVTLVVSDGPKPIVVPQLAGMTLDQAQAIAAQSAFTLTVAQQAMPNVPPGKIASQNPPSQTTIARGSAVAVLVSSGGPLTEIPPVISRDPATAEQMLQQAGFVPAPQYTITSPQSPDLGTVIDASPEPSGSAPQGSTVRIYISVPGEVPDTEGMSVAQAKAKLQAAGYQIGSITLTSEGADGNVVRTEPDAGKTLAPGQLVNLYVNTPGASPQP